MLEEKFKQMIGYSGYLISDQGNIFSTKRGSKRKLRVFSNRKGYMRVGLIDSLGNQRQVFVHRLVAENFIGPITNGYVVNHIDGDKSNNTLPNLEIITESENILHSCYVLGNNVKAVIQLDMETFDVIETYPSITLASKALRVDDAAIYKVCTNEGNFAGGFSWIFKDDYNVENIEIKIQKAMRKNKARCKKVKQINPVNFKTIAVYEGAREAIRQTGINSIISCASGYCKTAGGYIWRYID
ncbi:HNH endonuclease [Cytobacillus sp. FSL K6-0129]|uniref:HNH endonuclease n=1 Tax=Cytobacillus sp. FSL K6-0129 TaxID=2921421 RepID=UPI0030F90710